MTSAGEDVLDVAAAVLGFALRAQDLRFRTRAALAKSRELMDKTECLGFMGVLARCKDMQTRSRAASVRIRELMEETDRLATWAPAAPQGRPADLAAAAQVAQAWALRAAAGDHNGLAAARDAPAMNAWPMQPPADYAPPPGVHNGGYGNPGFDGAFGPRAGSAAAAPDPALASQAADSASLEPYPALEGVTTLVVCNIPSRFDRERLMAYWQPKFYGVDFIYMPWNASRRTYAGYAFVNFVGPSAAAAFCRQWHGQWLTKTKRSKRLRVSTAQLQGLEENLKHLKRTKILKFTGRSKWPAVFEDGVPLDVKAIMEDIVLEDLDDADAPNLPHCAAGEDGGEASDECGEGGESSGEEPFVVSLSL